MTDADPIVTIDDGTPPVAIVTITDDDITSPASSPAYAALGELLDAGTRHIVLDGSGLVTPTSTVLAMAIWTHQRVQARGRVALVVSTGLERICDATNLARILAICPDLATALHEVRRDDSDHPGSGGARVPRPTRDPSGSARAALDLPPDDDDDDDAS